MSEAQEKEKPNRKWRLELYPEDPTHLEALSILEQEGYKYVGIKHDKDIVTQEDIDKGKYTADRLGETKKEHIHVVVKFKNAVWKSALAKKLGISPNYILDCKNFDEACKYLLHATKKSADKYQYGNEELFGSLAPVVVKLLDDTDEGTRALNIIEIIEKHPGRMGYSELIKKAAAAGLYSDLRRMGAFAVGALREHNEEWYGSQVDNSRVEYDSAKFKRFAEFTGDKDIIPL